MTDARRVVKLLGTRDEIRELGELQDHTADQLLTIPECALRLNISSTTAYYLAARGHLPTVRFPGSRIVRVSAKALERFIESQVGHLYREQDAR